MSDALWQCIGAMALHCTQFVTRSDDGYVEIKAVA
jgi:hypothetical protein